MEGWEEEVNSSLSSFPMSYYCYLQFTQMRRMGTSQLEDADGTLLQIQT